MLFMSARPRCLVDGAWWLTEMGMTHGLQQGFPLSQSLLLIPLALEGHAGAGPHGCTKVAIAGERENASRQRFTVTWCNRKAAPILLEDASDFARVCADEDRRTPGGGDAVEFGTIRPSNAG